MNVFPINVEKKEKPFSQNEKTVESFSVSLPNNWWNIETSYRESANNLAKKKTVENLKFSSLKASHDNWSVRRGDYLVNEPYKKDYVYYRELKNKALKYSVFPALLVVGFVVYFISHILSNL